MLTEVKDMKTIRRGLLTAALVGAVFSSVIFSFDFKAHAGEQSAVRREPAVAACRGANKRPAHDDAAVFSQANNMKEGALIATAEGPIALGAGAVRVPLKSASAQTPERGMLAKRLTTLGANQRLYLVIRDLRAAEQPGVLYRLYLDLPQDAQPRRNEQRYIGSLNFFNSVKGGGYGAQASGSDFFFSYDITALVRNLQARRLLSERTTITIAPSGAPTANAAPTIGRIELVEQ